MNANEVRNEILYRASQLNWPSEVRDWLIQSWPEISDAACAIAEADGIEAAAKEVRRLHIAWLDAGKAR